jgi:hypothetical protein
MAFVTCEVHRCKEILLARRTYPVSKDLLRSFTIECLDSIDDSANLAELTFEYSMMKQVPALIINHR